MLIGIAVIITCLFYGIMVYITYSTKRKLNNVENKIYKLTVVALYGTIQIEIRGNLYGKVRSRRINCKGINKTI